MINLWYFKNKKMTLLSSDYWNQRYLNNEFAWDIGEVSAPLKAYIEQLKNKQLNILIPGAGNAYEADFLIESGFKNVSVLDFAKAPLVNIKKRNPLITDEQLIENDFFEHQGQYDLILEQTFFCALNPSLRHKYAEHMNTLLKPGGKLVGLLFNDVLNSDRPPFGGNKMEYLELFEPIFKIRTFEKCYNSIKPRADRELFMIMEKR